MTTVSEVHDEAMETAILAFNARNAGDIDAARTHAKRAMELEREAAGMVPDSEKSEPTRSILYLSAASLAYQAGDNDEATRLIDIGLSGNPSPRLKADFQWLKEMIARGGSG